ncbi:MAG: peptidylprolyl isomerase [Nitrospirota bacterium]
MNKGKKLNCLTILLAATVLMFPAAAISGASTNNDINTAAAGGKIIAKVNGQVIYENALAPYVEREKKKFQKYGAQKNTSALDKRLRERALDEVITLELIKQESVKMQINNIDETVKQKLKELKDKYENQEKYEAYLKEKGRTEDDVVNSIKSNIQIDEYLKAAGIKDPVVPEEEIKAYYEKSREGFRRKEYIKASHILIMVKEGAAAEKKESAREKAEHIRKEIADGRDFAEAAKEYSEDGRAALGGDLGKIERGYMPPEFDSAAFALKPGELSNIVETKYGYHIIKVLEKNPEEIVPYEDVRDFISKYLQEGLVKRKRDSLIKELKSKAEIEILLNGS